MEEEKHFNPQFEGLDHGITPDRIESSIHPMMICPKCKHIYWNPQMCSTLKCSHTLCEPCLKRALERGETCDKCKSSTQYEPNSFVANSLTDLTFRCMNHPKCKIILKYEDLPHHICIYDQMKRPIMGCEWNGERKSLEEHLPTCPKEIIFCPNEGCGEKEERGRLDQHREECLFEEIYCPKDCGYQGRRGVLTQHIEMECAKVKMPCPQCAYLFLRGELAAHRCLPFLLGMIADQAERIAEQESKYTKLEVSQNTLEARILKIEEKHKMEIERIMELTLIECELCKKLMMRNSNNIEGIGNVCGECLQQAHNNKLELRAISATSTHHSSYELSNVLQGGNSHWISKMYGGGEHPSTSDHIILGCKTGSMAITKLIMRLYPQRGINKMEIYVGEEGNWTLSHTLTQCQDNIIICLPHPLSAKFIKLKFTGVKELCFAIYEVQVFGIQLP